ncbi:hypothetical protein Tco_0426276 [Tanacetum coccineum]
MASVDARGLAEVACNRSTSVLLRLDRGQHMIGLTFGPLLAKLGFEARVIIHPRPGGLVYLLYVIKSSQSSMILPADHVLCAVVIARLESLIAFCSSSAAVWLLRDSSFVSVARISHFEILCRVHGFEPSVNSFRAFYNRSYSKGWFSFTKRSDTAPTCFPKPLDSVKNWNDRFFWVDSVVFPISVPLYKDMDLFAFIKCSDPTKGRVVPLVTSVTAAFAAAEDPATATGASGEESVLEDLNRSLDDVGQGNDYVELEERVVEEDADEQPKKLKKKRKLAGGASGSNLPPKKLRGDHHSLTSSTRGKSLAAVRIIMPVGSRLPNMEEEPFVSASVTPSSVRETEGFLDSIVGENVGTRHPVERYIVSSDDSPYYSLNAKIDCSIRSAALDAPVMTTVTTTASTADTFVVALDVPGPSHVEKLETSADSFYASHSIDSATSSRVYVPKWCMTNDSLLDNPYVCRDLSDRVSPSSLFAALRAMDYDQLYSEFNVRAARQMCLGAEVRMRAEHALDRQETEASEDVRLRGRVTAMEAAEACRLAEVELLKEKHALLETELQTVTDKVVSLKSVVFIKEGELSSLTANADQLAHDFSVLQTAFGELSIRADRLESEKSGLTEKVSSLESAFTLFKEQVEAMYDEQVTVLGGRVANLEAQLLEIASHLDEHFYPRFLTADRRDLSMIEAYDSAAESKYTKALNDLRSLEFPLLSELRSKKDTSIADLMDALRLEGPLAEAPGAAGLQPSEEQLMPPIHNSNTEVVLGETSLSFSLEVAHARAQRVKGDVATRRLSLSDMIVTFAKPLSSKSLGGEASTSTVVNTITTLSTTLAQATSVVPLSVTDYEVTLFGLAFEDLAAATVVFETEGLDSSLVCANDA